MDRNLIANYYFIIECTLIALYSGSSRTINGTSYEYTADTSRRNKLLVEPTITTTSIPEKETYGDEGRV